MKRYRNVRLNTDYTMEDELSFEEGEEAAEETDTQEVSQEPEEEELMEEVLDFGEEEI